MRERIVAIINQKGGVGKSTTAEALTAGLTLKGYRCLAIDLDSQGNLSYTAGAKTDGATALGVLMKEVKPEDALQHISIKPKGKEALSWDIIASNKALAGADAVMTETGKEYRLREALQDIKKDYDYIIVDTPPALGILTINALTASQSIIIPAQADIYSLQGIEQLAETIKPVRRYTNSSLKIAGILLTRYNPRSVLSKEIAVFAGKLADKLNTKLFKATIREAIAIKEAQISQQDIFTYAPRSKVAGDYRAFIEEFLEDEQKGRKQNGKEELHG